MGLINLLQQQGSALSQYDGATPPSYTGISNYPTDLAVSQLDLNGLTPLSYDGISNYPECLAASQLDLNGLTPPKYTDNLPG